MRVNVTSRVFVYLLFAGTITLSGCLAKDSPDIDVGEIPVNTNRAPTISGNPAGAVRIGDTYSFTPTASDPDGDTLTFSVQNKPVWATFDTTTGGLSGSPTLANVGTYDSITISVSDGPSSSSLAPYSIAVTQVALGTATLSWTAPTQNEDGSPLMDLAGYKIYYGVSQGSYSTSIRIDNPGIATFVVENLTPTTYYFVATAFNASGVESAFSGEAIKVVN